MPEELKVTVTNHALARWRSRIHSIAATAQDVIAAVRESRKIGNNECVPNLARMDGYDYYLHDYLGCYFVVEPHKFHVVVVTTYIPDAKLLDPMNVYGPEEMARRAGKPKPKRQFRKTYQLPKTQEKWMRAICNLDQPLRDTFLEFGPKNCFKMRGIFGCFKVIMVTLYADGEILLSMVPSAVDGSHSGVIHDVCTGKVSACGCGKFEYANPKKLEKA